MDGGRGTPWRKRRTKTASAAEDKLARVSLRVGKLKNRGEPTRKSLGG
jgi:hypothetical protein